MAIESASAAKTPTQDLKVASRAKRIAALEKAFRRAPESLSRKDLETLASTYLKQGQPKDTLRICTAGLDLEPDSEGLLAAKAHALFALGRRGEALAAYEQVFSRHETIIENTSRNRYHHLIKSLTPEEALASRQRATGPIAQQTERAYECLEQGRMKDAGQAFAQALDMVFADPKVRADWVSAFDALSRLSSGQLDAKVGTEPEPGLSAPKVLIPSGMGWSGSGAIFDYLTEFDEVVPRRGEFPIIQGPDGLASLAKEAGGAQLRRRILDLFRYHFFGFAFMPDWLRTRNLLHAKKAFIRENPAGGAALARETFNSLHRNLTGDRISVSCLQDILARYMFFQSGITPNELGRRRLLFDNIIHAYNLHALAFTRNITLFVCFRDPRSNYVSRLAEASKPMGPVEDFIKRYRSIRKKIDRSLKAVHPDPAGAAPSGVRLVQFEPFVLSRDYRLDLARAAGLDPARQREYSRFQPEVSRKNVFNFRTHPDQEAIRRIEAELGEYCLDLDSLERQHPPDRG